MQASDHIPEGTAAAFGSRTHGVTRRARQFHRDESGVMIVFGLIIFVLMLMIGGMAVDLMRFETTRSELQSISDRASLAAASLTQTLDPVAVVEDYYAKAGKSEYLNGVTVSQAVNFKAVSVDVEAAVPTMFMKLTGTTELSGPADSTAEERVSDIEITLVLDVSGSMVNGGTAKLANLKIAASNFVDTVLDGDDEEKISISIVPFNGQINAGPVMSPQYNWSLQHSFNNCADVAPAAFGNSSLPPGTTLTRSDVIDPWSTGATKPKPNGVSDQNYCTIDPRNSIRPFQRDPATLKGYINGLVGEGNTSIDIGMKWGLALEDPGTRSVITNLVNSGAVPANFAGRPFDFNREDTAKIMIVMSDGENTDQWEIKSPYKSGLSPISRNSAGNLVIYNAAFSGLNDFFVVPTNRFGNTWNSNTASNYVGTFQATLPVGYLPLTWPEVFNYHPVQWIARYLYGNPLGTNNSTRSSNANVWLGNFMGSTSPSVKDTRLEQQCDLAKDTAYNVRVFTIAFEAPAAGRLALESCASDGDYYQVQDAEQAAEIDTVFQTIARQISQLRLTQ